MRILLFFALTVSLGCSSADTVPISLDPKSVAETALQTYDSNGDGKLDLDELEACLALRTSLRRLDANKNSALEAGEISSRLGSYATPPQLVRPEIFVTLENSNLADVVVTLEPEEFMGAGRQAYQGTVGSGGFVALKGVENNSRDMNPGFYRVRIKSPDGQETIKGCEIAQDVPNIHRMTFVVR